MVSGAEEANRRAGRGRSSHERYTWEREKQGRRPGKGEGTLFCSLSIQ